MPRRQGISLRFHAALQRQHCPIVLDITDIVNPGQTLSRDFNHTTFGEPDITDQFDAKKWVSSRWKERRVYSKPPIADWNDFQDKCKDISRHGKWHDMRLVCDGKMISAPLIFEHDEAAILEDFAENKSRATLYKNDDVTVSFPRLSISQMGDVTLSVFVKERGIDGLRRIDITPRDEESTVSTAPYEDRFSKICNDL